MKKKILLLSAIMTLSALMASCSGSGKIKIGILQPAEFPALDNAREGFKKALANAGYNEDKVEFIYRNAGGVAADIVAFSKDLVGRCDMTLGIATDPSAALLSASIDKGITNPVLFTAVTDPVGKGLVSSLENGSGFVTGTSDINPVEDQVSLIKECNPTADKVGILYTQSEQNSVVQANKAKAALEASGISVSVQTATGPSDVSSAASALASVDGLDAIYIPTDNNIAKNTNAVKSAVQGSGILVVCGEEGMLADCGSVTLSVNYTKLGEEVGKMAVSILNKEKKAGEIPVGFMSKEECEYVMSSANAAAAGVSLPESVTSKCRDISLG